MIGDGIDLMADAYMGWTLDYAKRMLPLLEPFHLRWLEEPVIPDDTRGYKELKGYGRIPIAGGEHEFTIFGFRELLESNALDYIQFDTNGVGGSARRERSQRWPSLPGACSAPCRPDAQLPRSDGQPQFAHCRILPKVDVEVGNELFWYIFDGEPVPKNGFINLDDALPGLGLTVNEESLKRFKVIE